MTVNQLKEISLNSWVLIICLLCFANLLGCQPQSLASKDKSPVPSQASKYETISMATLHVGNGVNVQAVIEKLKEPERASSSQGPYAKLILRNLSTGKTIYEEENGDSSLYDPGFWIDHGAALIITSTGGSGNSIRVLEVTESEARVVLDEIFRTAATILPNDERGYDLGFFIVDAESGNAPLQVKRYQYNKEKKRYVLTGLTDFSKFIRSVQIQFKKI